MKMINYLKHRFRHFDWKYWTFIAVFILLSHKFARGNMTYFILFIIAGVFLYFEIYEYMEFKKKHGGGQK